MSSFDQPELVAYFTEHRNRREDLYPSEARFLPELASTAKSLLDVGCAAGGFVDIWRSYNPALPYTGVDLSPALIEAARQRHPNADFLVGDCADGLPLPDGAADVVAALGWLHWESRYEEALTELWRLTDRSLFFDVRLHDGAADLVGSQSLAGGGSTPYVCASWTGFAGLLGALEPARVEAYGYFGPPADTVSGVPAEVCLAAFVLTRGPSPTRWSLDLPLRAAVGHDGPASEPRPLED